MISLVWLLLNRIPSTLLKTVFAGLTVITVRLPQDENAKVPMLVTLAGMSMLVRPLHAENAE